MYVDYHHHHYISSILAGSVRCSVPVGQPTMQGSYVAQTIIVGPGLVFGAYPITMCCPGCQAQVRRHYLWIYKSIGCVEDCDADE
jgi:hypothetical protein